MPVRLALLSGLAVWLGALVLLSPWLRVRTVVWTGTVQLPDTRHRAFEMASLGQPLLLLPERALRGRLGSDLSQLEIDLRRHPPETLEIHLAPVHAVACTEAGLVLDERGLVLDDTSALPGLPRLVGFGVAGEQLEPRCRRLFALLRRELAAPALQPSRIERRDGELELTLQQSGARVRARTDRLEHDLLKLNLYEQSLGADEMPAHIDLRFRDQVVVHGGSGSRPAARASGREREVARAQR